MRPFCDDRREALRTQVRAFARTLPRRGLAPGRAEDARQVVAALAGEGLLALLVPSAHGGAAERILPLSLAVTREELAAASGFHDAMFAVQGLTATTLAHAPGGVAPKQWLPELAAGRAIGAFALTEPEAGSDISAMTSTARRTAEGYVLDGHKVFISNAGVADLYLVFARMEGSEKDFAAFAVPAATPGVEANPIELMANHVIGGLRLRGVTVPAGALVGAEGDGMRLALGTLEIWRPMVGAAACGMARRALDEALARTRVRKQFGKPLVEQQAIAHMLAEMATELEAARLLVYQAAWLKEIVPAERDPRLGRSASMAKLFATEAAGRVVDRAVQLHGAAGLVRGSVVESLYREVRSLRIYEGASEVLRSIIARSLEVTA
jgi:acyl-CoA dehydrogenase